MELADTFQKKRTTDARRKGPRELEIEKSKEKSGVVRIDDNTDVVKKGTRIQRVASIGEPVNDRPKYVSITEPDNFSYQESWDMLPTNGNPSTILYEATTNIKVASGKNVVDHIINKYGDVRYKDLPSSEWSKKQEDKLLAEYGNMTVKELSIGARREDRIEIDKNYNDLPSRMEAGKRAVSHLITNKIEDNTSTRSKIFEHYRSKGYDAIVDPVDYEGLWEYPVILLNPKKNIKKLHEVSFYY